MTVRMGGDRIRPIGNEGNGSRVSRLSARNVPYPPPHAPRTVSLPDNAGLPGYRGVTFIPRNDHKRLSGTNNISRSLSLSGPFSVHGFFVAGVDADFAYLFLCLFMLGGREGRWTWEDEVQSTDGHASINKLKKSCARHINLQA